VYVDENERELHATRQSFIYVVVCLFACGEFYSSGLLSEIDFEISETVERMSHSLPHTMLCHDNYYLNVQIYSKKNLKLGLFVKI
jgi:hypothetical protein